VPKLVQIQLRARELFGTEKGGEEEALNFPMHLGWFVEGVKSVGNA